MQLIKYELLVWKMMCFWELQMAKERSLQCLNAVMCCNVIILGKTKQNKTIVRSKEKH